MVRPDSHRRAGPARADRTGGPSLLAGLADRVRALREARGWSRARLGAESGVSVRFLARIESGEGNVSVLRLEALARALGTAPDALLRPLPSGPRVIALVGLRGAGKSTVGPRLAERLGLPFVEMDGWIAEAAGLPIDQIFELHGEKYYRSLERDVLRRILDRGTPCVLAAAGGVVNDPVSWDTLCRRATVAWLRATPEEHWSRVIAQGDRRPMADNPAAMDELRALLRAREPVYARAGITLETGGRSPDEVAQALEERLAATR